MRSRCSLIHLSLVLAAASACGDDNTESPPPPSSTFSIGGTISGLTAEGLVLQNNGGDDLAVAANTTSFVFGTKITSGSAYSVTVLTQPAGEDCTVTSGSGIATADVQSVSITCAEQHVREWTWMGGSDTAPNFGLPGVYGTLGIADAANIPGGRQQSASWRDSAGNLWLFGGYGVDSTGASGQLDDLWKYDVGAGQWTWISGTNVAPASTTGGAAGSRRLRHARNRRCRERPGRPRADVQLGRRVRRRLDLRR
jgi:hypothetical protein